ncbi:VOC family protein [Maribacter algicola]|uniref:VOC family protein n=1 Tax=Meishania litoralis TaxID=3434685 RepID=A0ACC7LL38_9FLAO
MKNPVGWFEIYVDDLNRAQKFYEKVLDVQLTELQNPTKDELLMLAFPADMEQHGSSGALVHMNDVKAGANSVIVYFMSEDCSIEESRVSNAGGRIITPKMSIGEYGFISLCNDTEGNMFGLHSLK